MAMIAIFGYTRKFKVNGRLREFTCTMAYPTKEEAESRAKEIRKSGFFCRIVRFSAPPGLSRRYTYYCFIYKEKKAK